MEAMSTTNNGHRKKLIPHLLSSGWGTLHFIKILAEKTKGYLKNDIEAKSYIDRE